MPTQTFFNLPEEKRQRILDAGVEEFASYPFKNVSIARIIEGAGIPRGSFYQYFEDAKDLYKYVITIVGEKKMERLGGLLQKFDNLTVFEAIRELYLGGIEFAYENPKLAEIGNRFIREEESFRQEILGTVEDMALHFYEGLIVRGQQRGEIDAKVDPKVGAFIFNTLNSAISVHFIEETKYESILGHVDEYMAKIDQMLFIIQSGFKSRN